MTSFDVDVYALGHALVDAVARVDEDFLISEGLEKGSMRLASRSESDALLSRMGGVEMSSGGSSANAAATVSALGGRSRFAGRVRDDSLGAAFRSDMSLWGAGDDSATATSGEGTGRALIAVTPDGERTMSAYLGAAREFSPSDVSWSAIESSAILLLEGYLWDSPTCRAACERAAERARGSNRKVALSLSDSLCVERHVESFRAFEREGIDVLLGNEREMLLFLGASDASEASSRLRSSRRDGISVMTRSEKGCVVSSGGDSFEFSAARCDDAIDVTGAGDAFAAGFLLSAARGRPLSEGAALGAWAAREAIRVIGGRAPSARLASAARGGV